MTQSVGGWGGGAENTFLTVTLLNFQKSGGAEAPPPQSLPLRGPCIHIDNEEKHNLAVVQKLPTANLT